ncbi:phosphate-starvation-inducible protein PsiE [Limosilactobacillus gorillae]|uniref:phosphate-starvation-inducible protein PsiE n=1 Tax=Limosilactobacillus gorillae TaxID=1450649 RepID=UPI001F2D1402|nr:phosphate-starvation-inducible protein PsiE [Limosilactobacillus gorillae]
MLSQEWFRKIAHLLELVALIAVGLLGLALIVQLGMELLVIIRLALAPVSDPAFYSFLNEVTSFFIIFEFIVMVIEALRNHGHISITMLMGLGLTALLRHLLAASNSNGIETIIEVGAIVLLTIGLAIYRRFVHDPEESYEKRN